MRNCFIHELELENDRGTVETSFLFFIADENCIPLSLITTFLHPFSFSMENVKYFIFLKFHWLLYKALKLTGGFVVVFLSHWLGKRCDSEQKIVRFVNQ